jgi:CO dehydrogenase/acetyl-CoA synthase beta subunit
LLLGEELREKSIKYLNEDLEDKIKNKNDIIKDNELKL